MKLSFRLAKPALSLLIPLCFYSHQAKAQAVASVITDYNGWWKSTALSPNSNKPDRSHNVLAFTYNGVQYSTGVNDALLASHGESFMPGDWWSLPVGSLSNNLTGNTKCGFGALYDGVYNGPSNPPPANGIGVYLTDGVKGLNLGTCIANLPAGNITFLLFNVDSNKIGDGIPDILVTQVADPSGNSFDRYQFTDASGNPIGIQKNVVFNSIDPVGTWTADFYEASNHPLTLQSSFTQTDRPVRLWAADLSEFNITRAQAPLLRGFKVTLCGNSDVAFVAYNNKTMNIQQTLAANFLSFEGKKDGKDVQLSWMAGAEQPGDVFEVERSDDGKSFRMIGSLKSTQTANYRYTDHGVNGNQYYRIHQRSADGSQSLSKTILVRMNEVLAQLTASPNPASQYLDLRLNASTPIEVTLTNSLGMVMRKTQLSVSAKIDLNGLQNGFYFLHWEDEAGTHAQRILVQR